MIYTTLTQKAMKMCYEAHQGQFDKSGVPYVFHPMHIAEQMDTEEEICVALLHDVLEDTDYTVEDICALGFPDSVIEAIRSITRPKGMDYIEYIKLVKKNKIATKVKLADLNNNSDEQRLALCNSDVEKLRKRYKNAKKELLN